MKRLGRALEPLLYLGSWLVLIAVVLVGWFVVGEEILGPGREDRWGYFRHDPGRELLLAVWFLAVPGAVFYLYNQRHKDEEERLRIERQKWEHQTGMHPDEDAYLYARECPQCRLREATRL